jgi:alanine racemase
MARPLRATIRLSALRSNLEVARRAVPHARLLAVIKANAYGHGLLRAAAALQDGDGFGVLELEAAVRLRESGHNRRILLLEGPFDPMELPYFSQHRLSAAVHSAEQIAMLEQVRLPAPVDVFLKLNTGMNRLGFAAGAAPAALERLRASANVTEITLMTHFANADDAKGIEWQLNEFQQLSASSHLPVSIANSATLLRYPALTHGWARPGIMLYGASPFGERSAAELGLTPGMTLASSIIAVQTLRSGDAVGYGGAFVAQRPTRIGVVACGYADGYPRHAGTGTPVLVCGRRTRTVGRVSMDTLCVDLTDLAQAGVGSPVVLWGEGLPVEDVATAAGTVSYELLCALAPRVPVVEAP